MTGVDGFSVTQDGAIELGVGLSIDQGAPDRELFGSAIRGPEYPDFKREGFLGHLQIRGGAEVRIDGNPSRTCPTDIWRVRNNTEFVISIGVPFAQEDTDTFPVWTTKSPIEEIRRRESFENLCVEGNRFELPSGNVGLDREMVPTSRT